MAFEGCMGSPSSQTFGRISEPVNVGWASDQEAYLCILSVSNWEKTTGQIQNRLKGLYIPSGICEEMAVVAMEKDIWAAFFRLLPPWPGPGEQRKIIPLSYIVAEYT